MSAKKERLKYFVQRIYGNLGKMHNLEVPAWDAMVPPLNTSLSLDTGTTCTTVVLT